MEFAQFCRLAHPSRSDRIIDKNGFVDHLHEPEYAMPAASSNQDPAQEAENPGMARPVDEAVAASIALGADGSVDRFDPAALAQMERMLDDLRRVYRERNEALDEVAQAHHEALFRLARAAEIRDDDTGTHILRMGFLSEALALELGWTRADAALLRQAAPMHDIGKIGLPDSVLKKSGQLTAEERQVMNQHPELGAGILGQSRIPLFQLAARVALNHHERWDGSGYPHGLAGTAIAESGRIVAVADCYDALTMDRCYRRAFADDDALAMMREQRGRHFDPEVVDAFIAAAPRMIALRDHVNRTQPSFAALRLGLGSA